MEKQVRVLDMVMSAGKTTAIIEGIKVNDMKFIFVTEYLTEVDRLIQATGKLITPIPARGEGSKRKHFLKLLEAQENIAITHSLFKSLQVEDYKLFAEYVLIIDEAVSIVEPISISKDDIEDLIANDRLLIDTNNTVSWNDGIDYSGNFNSLKEQVLSGGVELVNKSYLVWTYPREIFHSTKETIILTYLFEGSMLASYFKYYDIEYSIIPTTLDIITRNQKAKFRSLLDIYSGRANDVGKAKKADKHPLSKSWYINPKNKQKIDRLVNSTNNYFKNNTSVLSSFRAVSIFKDYEDMFSKRAVFIPVNKRATNEYRNISSIAYLIELNLNPVVERFFNQRNIKVDKDIYSLSGVIQLLWRGCIRDGKAMSVFIPSLRMRTLINKWLESDR